jgi:hypothetical protein
MNGDMSITNITGLLELSGVVARTTKETLKKGL